MAILVTGATGHLGPHLIAELLRTAHFDRLFVLARPSAQPASARVRAVERRARQHLLERGHRAEMQVVAIEQRGCEVLGVAGRDLREIQDHVSVIVHAAADTRFGAPLEVLRIANVNATLALCRVAQRCPRLKQLLFVSTTCVAGRRSGRIPEQMLDDSAGFANAYEQTKWEAEQVVAASGLPVRIARLSTCAGSHLTGYVHRFGALHHLLHWISRGLITMVPGRGTTPVDVISTDVAAMWLARAAQRPPSGLDVCHVALGENGIPLAALLDFLVAELDESDRRRVQRPALVDEAVFTSFSDMVRLSGDALLVRVQASAAAMLPSLLHPKVFDTQAAERCWGGPLPHAEWPLLLSRVIAFGRRRRWGLEREDETCHA
jgi:nucleoside-diphosphate-sugar epimerase